LQEIKKVDIMDKALLVYNPFSGDRGIANKLDYILERFSAKKIFCFSLTGLWKDAVRTSPTF